jgi:hypothetical protein
VFVVIFAELFNSEWNGNDWGPFIADMCTALTNEFVTPGLDLRNSALLSFLLWGPLCNF